MSHIKALVTMIAIAFGFSQVVLAAPSVRVSDLNTSKVELAADADINQYCIYGKQDSGENFIACSKVIGDMSRGIHELVTKPLAFNDGTVSFQLGVDEEGLEKGELTYIFLEQDVENPTMKSTIQFYDQVVKVIETYGPAQLEVHYVGPKFDTSLFGTPIPLFN
jgi:hypothetical protein